MCEFTDVMRIGGHKTFTKYEVLSFYDESQYEWLFEVVKIAFRQEGREWTEVNNAFPKLMSFPKKIQVSEKWVEDEWGKRKVPIYEERQPPRFYEKLRDKKITTKYSLPGKQRSPKLDFATDFEPDKNLAIYDAELVNEESADAELLRMARENEKRGIS